MKTRVTIATVLLISVIISIGLILSCNKEITEDDNQSDPIDTDVQNEKNAISNASEILPKEFVDRLQEEIDSKKNHPQYSVYLDSLSTAIVEFVNTLESLGAKDQFINEFMELQNNFQHYKSTNSNESNCFLVDLGIGYAKGFAIEIGASAGFAATVGAQLEASQGGGALLVYDFLNIQRKAYTFRVCKLGGSINAGLEFGLGTAGHLGFTGIWEWILGFDYSDHGIKKFEEPKKGGEFGINSSVEAILGINDIGISVAKWRGLNGMCDIQQNYIECSSLFFEDNYSGLDGFVVSAGGGFGYSLGAEITASIEAGLIGICSEPVDGSLKDFDKSILGRKYAGFLMAKEILEPDISNLICPFTVLVDLPASLLAINYSYIDPENCTENTPPIAFFEVNPLTGTTETLFEFDASGSSDFEEPITNLQVRWDFENDDNWDTDYTYVKIANYDYPEEGSYQVKLEVMDSEGLFDQYYIEITVTPIVIGEPCPGIPTITYGGQSYNTVQIGEQCWMKENLNIGAMINGSSDQTNNGTIEKYCYNNDLSYCQNNGGLYQWDEIMQYTSLEGAQGICPPAWHIPTDEEWKQLEGTVDSYYNYPDPEWDIKGRRGHDVGLRLKSSIGWDPGGNGSDLFNFSILPSGYRDLDGSFHSYYEVASTWTSNESIIGYSWYRAMYDFNNFNNLVGRFDNFKECGFGVRCIKD